MNRFYHAILISLASLILTSPQTKATPNTFALRNGQQLEGSIHMIRYNRVELNLKTGRRISVDLAGFSSPSQKTISNWARTQGGSLEFASWLKSPDTAFSKNWPRTVYGPASPVVRRNQTLSKPKHYVFESDHYRFISDEKLETLLVQKFTTLFETTYLYNMALPLNIPGRYRGKDHKFTIYLVGKYDHYLSMGGAPGSAGVYLPRRKTILVPMIALGVSKQGTKWAYRKGGENIVLAHEITHQLMDGMLSAPWYIEGSAEYIASTRYTHAAYHVYGSCRQVFDYVTSKKPSKALKSRQLGPRAVIPKLEQFMNMPYERFASRSHANRNYGIALLLTYYFYHVDGSGNAHNIKNYVKALQRGKTEAEAQKILLNGRSYASVQKSFTTFCAQNGLTLEYL